MKKIGLIGGMSWESTVTYYKIINEKVGSALGGSSSADMIIRSLDLAEIEWLQDNDRWDAVAYILTEEQLELKTLIADFLINELKPRLREIDESGEFPLDIYQKAFELGFHLLDIPEKYGGSGLNHETFGVLLEEMGYHDPGFAITILCSSLA
ncbi:MAG: acyl-CoA dehydrogenase family protein, partial [Firmicutes bacterium]|nr:acyl-CoA dehydrogenase family protein [Bacillota bacterium]